MKAKTSRTLLALLVYMLAAAAGLLGCGSGGAADFGSVDNSRGSAAKSVAWYAGELKSSDAFLCVVRDQSQVNAYLCDGPNGRDLLSEWYVLSSTDDLFMGASDGKSKDRAVQLSGRFVGASTMTVVGTVLLPDGRTLDFEIPQVGGDAGLYRGVSTENGVLLEGGWIVLPDGRQRGYIEQDNLIRLASAPTFSVGQTSVTVGSTLLPVSQVRSAFTR